MSVLLSGQVALVTGAGRRLGLAIAKRLAEEGMHLALHYHSPQSRSGCEALAEEATKRKARALILQADLMDGSECRRLVRSALEFFGRLDLLVASAANFERIPFENVDEGAMDRAFALNVRSTLSLVHEARHALRQSNGAVIIVTCTSASLPYPNYLPYVVSKGAARQLMRALAIELAPEVRVNAVAPGTVLPPESMSEAQKVSLARRTLLQRLGTPEDVAEAVVYLAKSKFITGHEILVDGGVVLAGKHSGE
ncbi:MAG: SDR family oxidoreductase [Deltaproteobacteria bacterium]|nr:SDR family oxidoreductase [Deltaproteobacteria bacterium]